MFFLLWWQIWSHLITEKFGEPGKADMEKRVAQQQSSVQFSSKQPVTHTGLVSSQQLKKQIKSTKTLIRNRKETGTIAFFLLISLWWPTYSSLWGFYHFAHFSTGAMWRPETPNSTWRHTKGKHTACQGERLVRRIHGADFKVAAFYVVTSARMTYIMCKICSLLNTKLCLSTFAWSRVGMSSCVSLSEPGCDGPAAGGGRGSAGCPGERGCGAACCCESHGASLPRSWLSEWGLPGPPLWKV